MFHIGLGVFTINLLVKGLLPLLLEQGDKFPFGLLRMNLHKGLYMLKGLPKLRNGHDR